jgi:DNA adenine methylase
VWHLLKVTPGRGILAEKVHDAYKLRVEDVRHPPRPKPFVKWAGGKGQLLTQFEPFWPEAFRGYVEPFVGGGAVFFCLHRQERLKASVVLNDANAELMLCYQIIRDDLESLLVALRRHEAHRFDPTYYYAVRARDRDSDFALRPAAERAARTLFLNRICYNGLYRVNQQGHFNVPFGRHRNPRIVNEENLRAVSAALQDVALHCSDFIECVEWVHPGDLVYLDPPYDPLSATSSFTNYTSDSFGDDDQLRLAEMFRELDATGCRAMLSNSDTARIRELYAGYRLEVLHARRAINTQGDGRSSIPELLILNY